MGKYKVVLVLLHRWAAFQLEPGAIWPWWTGWLLSPAAVQAAVVASLARLAAEYILLFVSKHLLFPISSIPQYICWFLITYPKKQWCSNLRAYHKPTVLYPCQFTLYVIWLLNDSIQAHQLLVIEHLIGIIIKLHWLKNDRFSSLLSRESLCEYQPVLYSMLLL